MVDEIKKEEMIPLTKEEYNDIPVYYCTECLSLKIHPYDEKTNYCNDCGNTEIKEIHIDEWDKLYKEKYKKSYLKI